MWQYAIKILLTSVIVVAISELAKRESFWGALLASLPLTSLLAFVWLYVETGDVNKVAGLSQGIFWLVIPSLPLFLILPWLLRVGWDFWVSLAVASATTAMAYLVTVRVLNRFGIGV